MRIFSNQKRGLSQVVVFTLLMMVSSSFLTLACAQSTTGESLSNSPLTTRVRSKKFVIPRRPRVNVVPTPVSTPEPTPAAPVNFFVNLHYSAVSMPLTDAYYGHAKEVNQSGQVIGINYAWDRDVRLTNDASLPPHQVWMWSESTGFTILTPPPGFACNSNAFGLTDDGAFIVEAKPVCHQNLKTQFIFRPGLGYEQKYPQAIDGAIPQIMDRANNGLILGYLYDRNNPQSYRLFVDAGDGVQFLDYRRNSYPYYTMNRNGDILGYFIVPGSDPYNAMYETVFRRSNGEISVLNSNFGQMIDLNDQGVALVYTQSSPDSPYLPVLWRETGITPLAMMEFPIIRAADMVQIGTDVVPIFGRAINNDNLILGNRGASGFGDQYAVRSYSPYLYDGNTMEYHSLFEFMLPGSELLLIDVVDLNDSGVITATLQSAASDGTYRAVPLILVPSH